MMKNYRGKGSIYRRKDGRWVAAIDIGRQNGLRKRISLYGDSQKEAATLLKQKLSPVNRHPLYTRALRKKLQRSGNTEGQNYGKHDCDELFSESDNTLQEIWFTEDKLQAVKEIHN